MRFIDAFVELAFMTDVDSTSSQEDVIASKRATFGIAAEVAKARAEFDKEIAKERWKLEEIKHKFLQKGDEIEGVQSLSTNILRVIKRLQVEDYDDESIWHALHGDYYEEHAGVDDIYDNLSVAIAMLGRDWSD
jgi:hypothetical protein